MLQITVMKRRLERQLHHRQIIVPQWRRNGLLVVLVLVVFLYASDDLVHPGQFVLGALGHAACKGDKRSVCDHNMGRNTEAAAEQHTDLVPQVIKQRRQPDCNRDDLPKAPGRVVDVVRGEPVQVQPEDVEAVDVQPEEDEMERRGADAQDRAGVGEERFRGCDAQLR